MERLFRPQIPISEIEPLKSLAAGAKSPHFLSTYGAAETAPSRNAFPGPFAAFSPRVSLAIRHFLLLAIG
jgi:hypothetical protein